MKKTKRVISFILAIVLSIGISVSAFASEAPFYESKNTYGVTRAPEYAYINAYGVAFRRVEVSPYNSETTPENNAAICLLNPGDYLYFIDLVWGADGRVWAYGQLKSNSQFLNTYGYVLASYVNISY